MSIKVNTIIMIILSMLSTHLIAADFGGVPLSDFMPKNVLTKSLRVDDYAIVMEKSSLEKNYLLTSAIIDGAPMPFGHSNKTMIVYFVLRQNSLYMFENLDGQLVSSSVPAKKLIAEFPILKEDDETVVFNFKEGMNRLMVMSEMYASDFGGEEAQQSIEITSSFLNKVTMFGKVLFIDQLLNVKAGPMGQEISLQVKYTVSEYNPNPNFKAKESNYTKKVGFFEVNPVFEDGTGRPRVNIMKFDTSKVVTYGISADVPADYKDAVKEGILYWNKAFGKEVLKVNFLESAVMPHDYGHNIVKWVQYDDAGFAYADINADPLTGEILQTHVYMTSVFAVSGKKGALKLLMKLASYKENEKVSTPLAIKGFSKQHICQHELKEKFVGDIQALLADKNLTDESVLRFSQDYVRSVIAHEVGHTLGLRHNFAGSTVSTIAPEDYTNLLTEYFKTGEVPKDKVTTSTVMDYTDIVDSVFQGAAIRLGYDAFDYDTKSLAWGYSDKTIDEIDFPLFCTDSNRNVFIDCLVWDRTNNPLQGSFLDLESAKKSIASNLAYRFFAAKTATDIRDRLPLSAVAISPKADVGRVVTAYISVLKNLESETQLLKVFSSFEFVNDFNKEDYVTATKKEKSSSLTNLGGLNKVLFDTLFIKKDSGVDVVPFTNELDADFQQVVTSDVFLNGGDLSRDEFIFSAKEIIFMSKISKKYFEQFKNELLNELLKALAKTNKLDVDGDELEAQMKLIAQEIIFSEGDKVINGTIDGKAAKVNESKYTQETRVLMVNVLKSNIFAQWPDFALEIEAQLKTSLAKRLSEVIGSAGAEAPMLKISRSLRTWVQNEKAIINSL